MRHWHLIQRLQNHRSLSSLLNYALILLVIVLGIGWTTPALAALPAGNAITDGKAILRYALPIDNPTARDLQASLEDIALQLRGKRWVPIGKDVNKAASIVRDKQDKLLASIPSDRQATAQGLLTSLQTELTALQTAVEAKQKEPVWTTRGRALDVVGQLEELMVSTYPFKVPSDYSNLPQLKGRATVVMKTSKGEMTIVTDGYSAPVTAGNFIDLVQRGFYDGLPFIRAEDSYVLQTGDPKGADVGFMDPKTGKYRAIPLEILAEGDDAPSYGITLEDAGRYQDYPVLPFSAYGALAIARPSDDPNGGSSQFFFFLFEPELTPAGRNLLDGRYAIFGYVTEGNEVLRELKEDDTIVAAKVVSGIENLVQP